MHPVEDWAALLTAAGLRHTATRSFLLDPDDPAGLRRRPDVFLLDSQTVHFAVKE